MKKRNLLSLSALVLSLGLVVTSCAGTPGAEGKPGAEGPQGPQGPQGEPGEPGKTYIDVITRDWNWEGQGTVTQDKFAVEAGKNETVTFTFKPASGKNLVLNVKINDVLVADVVTPNEKGECVFTLTVGEEYESVQLTSATFTTAKEYAQGLVTTALKGISDKDHLVGQNTEGGVNLKYSTATYFDTSLYGKVATINAAIEKAVTDAGKDTLKAYNDAVAAANKGIEEINTAYSKLIDDTKVLAKNAIKDLNEAIENESYAEADRTNDLNAANTAIDAATTLEEIVKVTLANAIMDGDKTLLAKGTYPTLLADKAAALTVLDTALNTVKDKEDWLDDEDSLMYTKLEEYGITAKELPTDIHKEYAAQISAATTIEKDKDGNSVVAKEGAEKIESVLSDIKDQLVEAIKADYFAEIDKSNSLAGYDNAKVTLKGVIEGTIANFVYADKDDIKTVESYVSTEANGLIYEIENALNDAVVQNGLKAFKVERAQNAINEALVTYKAKVDKTLENDALYKSVFGSKNANGKYSTVKNVLSWDEDFGNPYATTNPVGKDNLTDGFVYTGTQANPAFDDHYNGFKTQLEALISDPNEIGVDTFTTIANQLTENLGYIDNIYKSVVARFKTDLFNKYVNDKLGDNTYVTSAKLEEVWNGNKDADTMTKLSELANQVNDSIKKLDNLDTKISEFVSGLDTKDPDYDLATNGKETEKAIDEFVEDAFVSAPSDSDVNSFVSSLGDLYKADVEAYFTDGKDFVKERYQNIIATGIDLPTYQKVKAVYDKAIADVTEKPLTTITAVNNWIGKTLAQLERFSGVTPVTPIEGTDEVTGEVTNVEGVYIIDSTPSSDSEGNPLTYTNGADLKVKGEKVSETESKVTLTGDVSGNKLSQEQANGVGYAVDNVYFTFSVEFDPTTQYLRTSFLEDVSSATETNNSQTGWKVIPTSNAENGSQLFVVAPYAHQGSKFTIQVVTQGETKTVVRTIVVDYTDLVTTASPTPDTETPTDPVE